MELPTSLTGKFYVLAITSMATNLYAVSEVRKCIAEVLATPRQSPAAPEGETHGHMHTAGHPPHPEADRAGRGRQRRSSVRRGQTVWWMQAADHPDAEEFTAFWRARAGRLGRVPNLKTLHDHFERIDMWFTYLQDVVHLGKEQLRLTTYMTHAREYTEGFMVLREEGQFHSGSTTYWSTASAVVKFLDNHNQESWRQYSHRAAGALLRENKRRKAGGDAQHRRNRQHH